MSAAPVVAVKPMTCAKCGHLMPLGMWRTLGGTLEAGGKWWCGCPAGESTRFTQMWQRNAASKVPENFSCLAEDVIDRVHGDERALDRIETWAKDVDAAGLTITGPTGAGKTSAAAFALRQWIGATDGNERARFVDAAELALARRNSKLGKESPLILKACRVGLLVVDDVGSEPRDPSQGLEHVVFKRYAAGKQTIFTTWCALEELAARYGGGFARRIFDRATVIDLRGPQ